MLCRSCVLTDDSPDVHLDASGRCQLCATPQAESAHVPLESDLVRTLQKHSKRKGRYDCLVMCSGGKDSVAALYFMVKRFHMRPLVFTFDQGFGQAEAFANVHRATEALGLDWEFFRSDEMVEFFGEIVRTNAPVPICPPCSLWYMRLTHEIAKKHDIRLIITGWTRGQLLVDVGETPQLPTMTRAISDFIDHMRRTNPRYKDFPRTMAEVRRKHRKVELLSPHWFLPYSVDEYTGLIRRELGWRPITSSYPEHTTNCTLNFVSAYLSNKHWGFSHHHLEMSQLIRRGEVDRDEALRDLALDIDAVEPTVSRVLERLGCTWDQLRAPVKP